MQPDTTRTLAQYIQELQRRDRDSNRTSECTALNSTSENNADRDQRNRSGDAGRSQDHSG